VQWLEQNLPTALERSAALLVDSTFVRNELISVFRIPPTRVHTAHLGVASAFRPRPQSETAATLQSLSLLHGQYVLTIGTVEPRKNLEHTLEAYARLPIAVRNRYPLVIAGSKGWLSPAILKRLHVLGIDSSVRFLGRVVDAKLITLYAGAAVFIFPSRYEGFGLPPLEAMASGVPVIASDRGSLPEVLGDVGILVDPDLPEQTASVLEALLEDDNRRREIGARGVKHAAHFTWGACAAATLMAYRAALTTQAAN
jgi:alpha-1,3-rhamnosyl/mannosyltransferase